MYGPGNEAITGRVGIGTFGVFLHLGGANTIPFTYVDNCAEAIVLAGLTNGRRRRGVQRRRRRSAVEPAVPAPVQAERAGASDRSIVPHALSYALCCLWERYSDWSEGQLPPAFNRRSWHAYWKKTRYSNEKLKTRLGWTPKCPTAEGLERYFESCREKARHA